jgi:hypothetical protein
MDNKPIIERKPYIMKRKGESPRLTRLEGVEYTRKTRVTGYMDVPGFGRINKSEFSGWDKTRLEIRTSSAYLRVDSTPAGIKEKFRRLRPQEAELIDQIDSEIAAINARRQEIINQAWTRAHVVTVKELKEKITKG